MRPFNDLSEIVESINRGYDVEAESLAEVFRNLDEKLKKKILVVIDQFEEVLCWHAGMLEELILDFYSIHGLETHFTPVPNTRYLSVSLGPHRRDALCGISKEMFFTTFLSHQEALMPLL